MTAKRAAAETGRREEILRWVSIVVRTAHMGTAAMLFGLALVPGAAGDSRLWLHLAIATGDVLVVLELLQDRRWLHRGKGLLGILHIGLFVVWQLRAAWTVPLLWAILVVGSICSHMPRRYRHWSILQGWEQQENED